MPENRPLVGVGVFLFHPDHPKQTLLGKRKGAHGAGQWSLPGGHLELWESFQDVCEREVMEETGLKITSNVKKIAFTNDMFRDHDKHYITLFFSADCSGEVVNKEPDKCDGWEWFSSPLVPDPLFPPLKSLLQELMFGR